MDQKIDLRSPLSGIYDLSNTDWESVSVRLEQREMQAGDFLLRQDENYDFTAFVLTGIFVYSRFLDNGDEYTTDFAFPVIRG